MSLQIVGEDFKVAKIKSLGEGTFGSVGLWETTNGKLVIKETKLNGECLGYPPDLLNEVDMLIKFRSLPNIVQIKGAHFNPSDRSGFIVLEELDISLDKWIVKTPFEERIKILPKLIHEIGYILALFYKYSLIHNDIKSDNILMKFDQEITFKLADFGKSKFVSDRKIPYGGIPKYTPPNFISVFHSEWWAFMICLLDLILGPKKIKSKKRKVTEFFIKYKNGIDLNIEKLLRKKLSSKNFNAIPSLFWDFLAPLRQGSEIIGEGLDNIGYKFDLNLLAKIDETILKSSEEHPYYKFVESYCLKKFSDNRIMSCYPKFFDLFNKFLFLAKLKVPRKGDFTIFYWAEIAFLTVTKNVKKSDYFGNFFELLTYQRQFLAILNYQTIPI